MFDQVNVHKDPAFADLGARDLSGACLFLQRYGMNVQERCSGFQIERVHGSVDRNAIPICDSAANPAKRAIVRDESIEHVRYQGCDIDRCAPSLRMEFGVAVEVALKLGRKRNRQLEGFSFRDRPEPQF